MSGARAFVTGWPITHSRSPLIHGFWLKELGIDGSYEAIGLSPEEFESGIRQLAADGFAGGNVTVPHKEAAFALCDACDELARRLKAVNTLVFRDGRIEGRNTDGEGFLENLRLGAPGWSAAAGPAVLLGAGGASRAVAAALEMAGAPEVRIVNRTVARAEQLIRDIGLARASAHGWNALPDLIGDAALLVNATSLGMAGSGALEIDLAPLPRSALVTDIVYVPLETELLKAARARGNPTVDGLGMLLYQAVPGFEAWFGTRPEVTDALRAHILADIARA